MKEPTLVENIIGWIATFMVLIAYSLNALGFINATTPTYIYLNLIGATGVAYIAYRYKNYQSALINIVWVVVAIIALISLFLSIS